MLAITGASAALAISSIPFTKTIAGVRIGLIDGNFVVNPTYPERKTSRLDLIVAGSSDAIMMVEAGSKEVSEEEMVTALETAHAAIREIIATIEDLKKAVGKTKKTVAVKEIPADFLREVEEKAYAPLADAMRIKDKLENYSSVDQALANLVAGIAESETERRADAKKIFKGLKEKVMRDDPSAASQLDSRRFGRSVDHDRSRRCRVHGSAVFTRARPRRSSARRSAPRTTRRRSKASPAKATSVPAHYNFRPLGRRSAVPARSRRRGSARRARRSVRCCR